MWSVVELVLYRLIGYPLGKPPLQTIPGGGFPWTPYLTPEPNVRAQFLHAVPWTADAAGGPRGEDFYIAKPAVSLAKSREGAPKISPAV